MSKISVILLKDVKSIGRANEVVQVSAGYAQNYLFPNKLASLYDSSAAAKREKENRDEKEKRLRAIKEAEDLAKKLESTTYLIETKAKDGKIFGAISHKDIVDAIKRELSLEIDKKRVLSSTIKSMGIHNVDIKLHSNVIATIKVLVRAL